ncbi:hypothetical protein V2G26_000633 [Clonostachys chloroleuca]
MALGVVPGLARQQQNHISSWMLPANIMLPHHFTATSNNPPLQTSLYDDSHSRSHWPTCIQLDKVSRAVTRNGNRRIGSYVVAGETRSDGWLPSFPPTILLLLPRLRVSHIMNHESLINESGELNIIRAMKETLSPRIEAGL